MVILSELLLSCFAQYIWLALECHLAAMKWELHIV